MGKLIGLISLGKYVAANMPGQYAAANMPQRSGLNGDTIIFDELYPVITNCSASTGGDS
jgi:hypothetical protein